MLFSIDKCQFYIKPTFIFQYKLKPEMDAIVYVMGICLFFLLCFAFIKIARHCNKKRIAPHIEDIAKPVQVVIVI